MDFTPDGAAAGAAKPLIDRLGHGTHVAGTIAGYWESPNPDGEMIVGKEQRVEETDDSVTLRESLRVISGVAPKASLISLKVIADVTSRDNPKQTAGQGKVSWILKAIDQIQTWNQNGRRLLIHGVNLLSATPSTRSGLAAARARCAWRCRLVQSGVVVVVSAGMQGTAQSSTPTTPLLKPNTAESQIHRSRQCRPRHHGRIDAP